MIVGDFNMQLMDTPVAFTGVPMAGGDEVAGEAAMALIRGPESVVLEAAVIRWPSGDAEVKGLQLMSGGAPFTRAESAGRLGIYASQDGSRWCELRMFVMDTAGWATMKRATLAELDELLGASLSQLLIESGAERVGTREEILADTGRRRAELAVVFSSDNVEVPLAAFVATRLVPLHKRHGQHGAKPAGA